MVELCLHIANILYLLSFLGRDMLCLRVLTCAGLSLGILFFSCQATPMYGPTAWHVLFLAINSIQIRRLLVERRRLMLSKEQERVADATFHDLSREELVTLLTRAMSKKPANLSDIPQICHQQLSAEEQALRDIAFNRLSRAELTNLLTRRMWNSLKRLNPIRWRRRNSALPPLGRGPSELEAVPESAG